MPYFSEYCKPALKKIALGFVNNNAVSKWDKLGQKTIPREALSVKADYPGVLTATRAVNEIPCYGDQIALTLAGEAIFNFAAPQSEVKFTATLQTRSRAAA